MQVLISNYSLNSIPVTYSTAFNQEYEPLHSEHLNESVTVANVEPFFLNSRIFSLLAEYEQLPSGWDEDDAIKPDFISIRIARYIALILEKSGQKIFHVAPGSQGEIMVDLRSTNGERSIEIILYSQRFVYVTFCPNNESRQGTFEINLLPELLEWLNSPKHG